jgi:membrane protein YqaA with SNARE-associated domain
MVLGEAFVLWANQLIIEFSYLGIFIISVISSSTIFLPFPIYVVIFFAPGIGLNPLLVGLVAGIGSAVGELTGYFIGLGGEKAIEHKEKKQPKLVKFFENLFKKYGFPVIVITAFIPFPFDIIGILSGLAEYDIKKFFIAVAIGKILKTTLIAYAGFIGLPYILHLLGE